MKNKNIAITKASGVQDKFHIKIESIFKKFGADENTISNISFKIEFINTAARNNPSL